MALIQKEFTLSPKPRGYHLVTQELVKNLPELKKIGRGIAHFFIQHTSASLLLSENADPDVRGDLERHFNQAVPENAPYYQHVLEGADDMPAHIKSALFGAGVTVPITDGRLNLGTWQGIVLGEHRDAGGGRRIVVTLLGEL